MPPVLLCPPEWVDASKVRSLGIPIDALRYSLGYMRPPSDLQFGINTSSAKSEFISYFTRSNFTSLLDYYMGISIEIPIVYTEDEFDKLDMAIKLTDRQSKAIGRYATGYDICQGIQFIPTTHTLYSATSATLKYNDKSEKLLVGETPGEIWVELGIDLNFLSYLAPPVVLRAYTANRVFVSTTRFQTLDRPDAPCKEDGDVDETYSATACVARCQNERYTSSIGCKLLRYDTVKTVTTPMAYCNHLVKIKGINMTFSEFHKSSLSKRITDECLTQCPPKCDRRIHQMFLQWQKDLPGYKVNKTANSFYVDVQIENIAKYQGQMTVITEVNTYTFTSLINNVGGTWGLFVGATLITFVQLVMFLIQSAIQRGKGSEKI